MVLGPTASGKSDVAMAYAATTTGVEIVVVDAMQVYRGMDIGTAKPTTTDRVEVPHHGLDLADAGDDFTVAEFVTAAGAALEMIASGGGVAVLVAGTGLYLRAITDPMEIPGTWPWLRTELEQRAQDEGVLAVYADLQALDPVAASRMEPTNTRRVVRALEVCRGSGRLFSSFGPGLNSYPEVPFTMVGLRWPRAELGARIKRRVHHMIDRGLVDEVTSLLAAPGGLSRTARQALGYKELIDHLEGRSSRSEAIEQIVVRTRQFAVRQERWFRRDPRVHWVDVVRNPVAEVLPVLRDLNRQ